MNNGLGPTKKASETGFHEEEVKCLKEFDDAFQANVSDPSLCRYVSKF